MVVNRGDIKRKRKDNSCISLIDDSPKRTKVHAQRKFAQGSNVSSPVITPVKEIEKQERNILPEPQELLPIKRPNTEDFLTFLCFRGTPILPSSLNFFNTASMIDTRTQTEEPKPTSPKNGPIIRSAIAKTQNERPFIAFGVRKRADPIVISKQMDKKRRHALALQALRRKYQEQKMAKIRAVTISKLSEKITSKSVVRTRSVTKNETVTKKNIMQKTKIKVVATKRVTTRTTIKQPIRGKLKSKMCLRSFRGRYIHHELGIKARKRRALAKKMKSVQQNANKRLKETSSEFSSDDDEPLAKGVPKAAKKSAPGPKKPAELNFRLTRSNRVLLNNQLPARKQVGKHKRLIPKPQGTIKAAAIKIVKKKRLEPTKILKSRLCKKQENQSILTRVQRRNRRELIRMPKGERTYRKIEKTEKIVNTIIKDEPRKPVNIEEKKQTERMTRGDELRKFNKEKAEDTDKLNEKHVKGKPDAESSDKSNNKHAKGKCEALESADKTIEKLVKGKIAATEKVNEKSVKTKSENIEGVEKTKERPSKGKCDKVESAPKTTLKGKAEKIDSTTKTPEKNKKNKSEKVESGSKTKEKLVKVKGGKIESAAKTNEKLTKGICEKVESNEKSVKAKYDKQEDTTKTNERQVKTKEEKVIEDTKSKVKNNDKRIKTKGPKPALVEENVTMVRNSELSSKPKNVSKKISKEKPVTVEPKNVRRVTKLDKTRASIELKVDKIKPDDTKPSVEVKTDKRHVIVEEAKAAVDLKPVKQLTKPEEPMVVVETKNDKRSFKVQDTMTSTELKADKRTSKLQESTAVAELREKPAKVLKLEVSKTAKDISDKCEEIQILKKDISTSGNKEKPDVGKNAKEIKVDPPVKLELEKKQAKTDKKLEKDKKAEKVTKLELETKKTDKLKKLEESKVKLQEKKTEEPKVSRPSRKTKEAAAIYMEILGHKLVNDDEIDDDDISIDSYPELPNVRKTEQRENELKAKAKSKASEVKVAVVKKSVDKTVREDEMTLAPGKKCTDEIEDSVDEKILDKISKEEVENKVSVEKGGSNVDATTNSGEDCLDKAPILCLKDDIQGKAGEKAKPKIQKTSTKRITEAKAPTDKNINQNDQQSIASDDARKSLENTSIADRLKLKEQNVAAKSNIATAEKNTKQDTKECTKKRKSTQSDKIFSDSDDNFRKQKISKQSHEEPINDEQKKSQCVPVEKRQTRNQSLKSVLDTTDSDEPLSFSKNVSTVEKKQIEVKLNITAEERQVEDELNVTAVKTQPQVKLNASIEKQQPEVKLNVQVEEKQPEVPLTKVVEMKPDTLEKSENKMQSAEPKKDLVEVKMPKGTVQKAPILDEVDESLDESNHSSTGYKLDRPKKKTKTQKMKKVLDQSFSDSDEEPLSKLTQSKEKKHQKEGVNVKATAAKQADKKPDDKLQSKAKAAKEKAEKPVETPYSAKPKRECTKRPQNYLPLYSSSDDEEKYFHGFVKSETKSVKDVKAEEDKCNHSFPTSDLSCKDVGRRFGKGKVNMSNEQIEKWLNDSAMAGMTIKKENDEMLKFGEKIPTETTLELHLSNIDTEKLKTTLLKKQEDSSQKEADVAAKVADDSTSVSVILTPETSCSDKVMTKAVQNERKTIFRKEKSLPIRNVKAFSANNESSVYAFEAENEDCVSTPFRRPSRRPSSTATSKSEDEVSKLEDNKNLGKFRLPAFVKNEAKSTNKNVQSADDLVISTTANLEVDNSNSENQTDAESSDQLPYVAVQPGKHTATDVTRGRNQKFMVKAKSSSQTLVGIQKPEEKPLASSTPMFPPTNTIQKSKGDAKHKCGGYNRSSDRMSETSEEFKYKVPSSPSASSSSSTKLYKRQNAKTRTRPLELLTPVSVSEFPSSKCIAQMVEAPVFYPTDKEFQDPIEYIDKIRAKADKFGICRIVPPSNFKPECKVSDDMRFTAYNQYVHKMLHRWGPNFKELMAIKKYLQTQNITLTHPPWIGGMEIDLPRLYQTVQLLGGLKEVIEKKRWPKVSEAMKIPKSAQDRVTKLDDIYCKYLLPYDTLSPAEREKLFDEVETEWAKRESKTLLKMQDKDNKMDMGSTESESEPDDESEECIVKGRSMALNAFYRIARNTMSMWFKTTEPSALEVEQEFWKHVTVRKNHICVHSGSIDSGNWGYGFAVSKNSPFARHAWNLKVLTNNSGSVLRAMGPLMGVTVPTLHVGMVFSSCCWYRDPHSLPWIEYLHTGGNKIWYGIPDTMSEMFHTTLLKLVPNYCKNKSLWLPSDTAMIPPNLLVDNGVSLSRTVQEPGQFVVVFPKVFTSSISTGYVVSESVYFAPPYWLETAQQMFDELRNSCEPSMFSLDRLLLSIIYDSRTNVDVLRQIIPQVQYLCDREMNHRKKLLELGLSITEKLPLPESPAIRKRKKLQDDNGDYECEICRTNLFISLVTESQDDVVYCLEHALEHVESKKLEIKNCKLMFTYDYMELESLVDRIKSAIETKMQKKVAGKYAGLPTMLK